MKDKRLLSILIAVLLVTFASFAIDETYAYFYKVFHVESTIEVNISNIKLNIINDKDTTTLLVEGSMGGYVLALPKIDNDGIDACYIQIQPNDSIVISNEIADLYDFTTSKDISYEAIKECDFTGLSTDESTKDNVIDDSEVFENEMIEDEVQEGIEEDLYEVSDNNNVDSSTENKIEEGEDLDETQQKSIID